MSALAEPRKATHASDAPEMSTATLGTTHRGLGASIGWWLVMLSSVGVALFSLRFWFVPAAVLYSGVAAGEETIDQHFVGLLDERLLRFGAHFVLGPIALLLGPFQFLDRLRRRRPALHRRTGWVYAVACLGGGLAGLVLSTSSWGGLATHSGFMALAVLWIVTTIQAVRHARARRFALHRVWMLRSFALTFAAVTLRIQLGIFLPLGFSMAETYQTVAWASWVPNLLLVEWWLARGWRAPEAMERGRL
jgi:hypothetical protein